MYRGLQQEMKRRKVTQKMLASIFSGRQATISYKIKHQKFYLEEALLIRDVFFPDCILCWLWHFWPLF